MFYNIKIKRVSLKKNYKKEKKMTTLATYSKGDKLKVLKLHTSGDLKRRLISFGVMKDAEIEVLGYSTTKSTIEIKVSKMRIALRAEEAQKIEVIQL